MKDRKGALKIQQTLAETCEQYPAQQNMFQREYVRTMLDLCQDHNSRPQKYRPPPVAAGWTDQKHAVPPG